MFGEIGPSQKVQKFGERSILIKKYFLAVFDFDFQKFLVQFLGGVKVWVQIWDFWEVFKTDIWQRFWQALCAVR